MTRSGWAIGAMLLTIASALALDGQPAMHDPSTVIEAGGKFYVYATGSGLPAFQSDDGWTWRRTGSVMQAVPGGKPGPAVIGRGGSNTWAPDIIRSGDEYFLYYAAPGPQPKAAVGLVVVARWTRRRPTTNGRTRDPSSARTVSGAATRSTRGVMRDPTNGTMWLSHGSYFDYIRFSESRLIAVTCSFSISCCPASTASPFSAI